jgi:anaerobic sulfite reductase subunit C
MAVMNYKGLKKGSLINPVNDRKVSLRLRVTGGKVTGKQLQKVYDIANIYGKGYIHMASQHNIEIPFLKLEDMERIKKELRTSGLETGL